MCVEHMIHPGSIVCTKTPIKNEATKQRLVRNEFRIKGSIAIYCVMKVKQSRYKTTVKKEERPGII